MTYTVPPLKLPGSRSLTVPITRPFNIDKDCVLCLLPEINTKWIDHSLTLNDGTITEAALKHYGRFGPCLYFDGVNDKVACSHHADYNITGDISFEIWTRILSTVENGGLFYKLDQWAFRIKFLTATTADLQFWMTGRDNGVGATNVNFDEVILTKDEWAHLIVTLDDTNAYCYLNGELAQSHELSGATDTTNNTLYIGHTWDIYLKQDIDEFRIYKRTLAAWEARALYNLGAP